MNYSVSALISCPFFQKETENLLCCEGYIDGTCMTTSFRSRKDALQYISDNCSHIDGGSCPMAKNLYEKYRRLQEEEDRIEREWREKLTRVKGLQHFAQLYDIKENSVLSGFDWSQNTDSASNKTS